MNSLSNSNEYANIYRGSFMPLKAIEVPSDLYHDLPEELRLKLDALLEYSPDADYGCGSLRRYENFERECIEARSSLIEHYATLDVERYTNLTIEKLADIFLQTINNGDIAKTALLLKNPKINGYKDKIIENCAFFAFTHLQKLAEEEKTEMFAFLLRDAIIAPIITKAKHKTKEISSAIDAAIKYNVQIEEGYKLGKFLVLMARSYPQGIPCEISEHMATSDKFALDAFNCFGKRESREYNYVQLERALKDRSIQEIAKKHIDKLNKCSPALLEALYNGGVAQFLIQNKIDFNGFFFNASESNPEIPSALRFYHIKQGIVNKFIIVEDLYKLTPEQIKELKESENLKEKIKSFLSENNKRSTHKERNFPEDDTFRSTMINLLLQINHLAELNSVFPGKI